LIYGYLWIYYLCIHMRNIILNINELRNSIDNYRPISPNLQAALQERLKIEWTYNSNAIEGSTLTIGETAFFLREGLTSEGRPLKDYLDAKNHAEAIDGLHDIIKKKRIITEGLIKELHGVLLKGVEFTEAMGARGQMIQKEVSPGRYKRRPNHVLTLSGRIHHYVDPLHVTDEMEKLLIWYNRSKALYVVERAATFHYRFVRIHPFDDGNGRLARILMNLILMMDGFSPCIIRQRRRRQYLESLEIADSKGNETPFIMFVAEEMHHTQQTILSVLKGEDAGYMASDQHLNQEQRKTMILERLKKDSASIGQLHKELPTMNRATLKSDLKRLVLARSIKKKGQGKGVIYFVERGRPRSR
jgi:Fic family protein